MSNTVVETGCCQFDRLFVPVICSVDVKRLVSQTTAKCRPNGPETGETGD